LSLKVNGVASPYFMTANTDPTGDGKVAIYSVGYDAGGIVVTEAWQRNLDPDYRIAVPFPLAGNQWLLWANTTTGRILIRQIIFDDATQKVDMLKPTFDSDLRYERQEGAWRDQALAVLGCPPGYFGVQKYCQTLRETLGTDWAYAIFVTRYGAAHYGYAGSDRIVYEIDVDKTPTDIVFAHETGHIFGAADEYVQGTTRCSLTRNGFYRVLNRNCEADNPDSTNCLMKNNKKIICNWSRAQWGWLFFTSLAPFELAGRQWIIGQDRDLGHAVVQRIENDPARPGYLTVPDAAWSAEWNPDYAVYSPFTLTFDGEPHQYLFTSNTKSGRADIRQISYDATLDQLVVSTELWHKPDWGAEIRVAMPFELRVYGGMNQYLLAANTFSGDVSIHRIWRGSTGPIQVIPELNLGRMNPDYRVYVPFTLTVKGLVHQYFFTANVVTGTARIYWIHHDKTIVLTEMWHDSTLSPAYRNFLAFTLTVNGSLNQYLLAADSTTGNVVIRQISYNPATHKIVNDLVMTRRLDRNCTVYVPLTVGGKTYYLTVDNTAGRMIIRGINATGTTITVSDPAWQLP
jgi:hypothetical protein